MEETGLILKPFWTAGVVLALGGLMVVLSLIGYRRTTRSVPARLKLLLLLLRLGAVGLLTLCLLRPSLQTVFYEVVRRPLVFLIDQSRSMSQIDDTPEGVSRLAAIEGTLQEHQDRLEELREGYEVMTLGFARDLLTGPEADGELTRYSAYGQAIEQAFTELTSSQSDALVVLGDGSHNYGRDPMDVAASLNAQGVPVFTVGVGQDEATSELRDVKLIDVSAPKTVPLFTAFPLRAEVRFRGCVGLNVRVRLDFPGHEAKETVVHVAHSDETVPVEFEIVPEKVDDYKLTVSAEPVPNEVLETNNARSTFVKVVSAGVRVGFFDTLRPESKFIARSLEGAEHLTVRRVLILAGQRLPHEQTETERYDVVVLGDLTQDALRPSRILELRKGVQEEGKGLIVLLSAASAEGRSWQGSPVEDLLPVTLGSRTSVASGLSRFRPVPMHADHPVLAVDPADRRGPDPWEELPPLAGVVAGVEPKRGATVLAADEQGRPLLVVHRSGRGRVACLTADTTFRWFFTEQQTQDIHRRFWRQMALWAAGREEEPESRLRLELSRQQVQVEEALRVSVRLVDREDQPIRDADLALNVTGPDGRAEQVPYTFSRQEGAYLADYVARADGDYLVAAEAKRGDEVLGSDRTHFNATSAELELEEPMADLKLLRRISAVTEEAGGRYFHYLQAEGLFDELENRANPLKLTTRRRRDIWDDWPLFALFTALLGAEWGLRKWKGLI